MSNEFERENRYIVLKRKHLGDLPNQLQLRLKPALDQAIQAMPRIDCLVVESDWPEYEPTWAAIEARVTGNPAEQCQSEPVALPERKQYMHQGLSHTDAKADGWNACLDELAKLGPLYTNADPAEVLNDLEDAKEACTEIERTGTPGDVIREMNDELVDLRAQLAERDALLRDALNSHGVLLMTDPPQDPWKTRRISERIMEVLSASAEKI